ncbi:MAG: MFS transporter [Pseudomonadota bacterium]
MAARLAVLGLALGQTLVWAALYYLFPALLLAWEEGFGWGRGEIALALTIALLVSAGATPLMGRVIDRGYGRLLLTLGAVNGALALSAVSQVESLSAFYALWALIGLAMAACLYEPCFAYLTRLRGAQARTDIMTVTLIGGFASTISFPVGTGIAAAYGWQTSVAIFAAIAAGVAAPLFWLCGRVLERKAPETQAVMASGRQGGAVRAALATPAFWMIGFAFSMMALVHGVVINHLLPFLAERGVAEGTAVLAASMIGPMQVAGRVAMISVGRGLPALALAVLSFAGVAAAVLCLLGAGVSALLLAGFVVLQGACYGLTSILRPVVIAETLGRQDFGVISGLLAMPYLASAAIAPFAGAVAWGAVGYGGAFLAGAGLAVVGAVCIGLARRR